MAFATDWYVPKQYTAAGGNPAVVTQVGSGGANGYYKGVADSPFIAGYNSGDVHITDPTLPIPAMQPYLIVRTYESTNRLNDTPGLKVTATSPTVGGDVAAPVNINTGITTTPSNNIDSVDNSATQPPYAGSIGSAGSTTGTKVIMSFSTTGANPVWMLPTQVGIVATDGPTTARDQKLRITAYGPDGTTLIGTTGWYTYQLPLGKQYHQGYPLNDGFFGVVDAGGIGKVVLETGASSAGIEWDHIQYGSGAVTPEPVSMALLGTGIAVFTGYRRRRRKKAGQEA